MITGLSVAGKSHVTYIHPVETDDLGSYIEKPHVPRGTVAVDKEHPNGTPDHKSSDFSVLQQHAAFFDRDHDGIIYPWETFAGFRAIGFNFLWSFAAMFVVNLGLSYPTQPGWIPSLLFPIYIKNIHRSKHGSDSEVYDTEGRFVPQKFEEIFSKFDHGRKGALSFWEFIQMTEANRNVMDPFGWVAAKLEWGLTYILLKNREGLVRKEDILGVYDGSIFERIERGRNAQYYRKKYQ